MGLVRNPDFVRLFAGRLVTNAGDSHYYVAAAGLTLLAVYLASIPQFRRLPRIADVETLAAE